MSTSHARHVPNDTGTDSDAIRGFYSYNRLTNRGHESECGDFTLLDYRLRAIN